MGKRIDNSIERLDNITEKALDFISKGKVLRKNTAKMSGAGIITTRNICEKLLKGELDDMTDDEVANSFYTTICHADAMDLFMEALVDMFKDEDKDKGDDDGDEQCKSS